MDIFKLYKWIYSNYRVGRAAKAIAEYQSSYGCKLSFRLSWFQIWNSDCSTNELESKRKLFLLLLPFPNIGQKHISYYHSFNHFIHGKSNIFMGVFFITKSKVKLNVKMNFFMNALSWQRNGNEDIVTWL